MTADTGTTDMSVNSPEISVIMSAYNAEKFVGETIESITQQTFTNFEFIIVDDGSTDATPEILSEWAARDQRIHVTTQENQGLTRSLCEAVSVARAPLLARIDADDIALPKRLEHQYKAMQSTPDLVVLGTQVATIDGKGQKIRTRKVTTGPRRIRDRLVIRNCINHSSAMLRRKAVLEVGNYNPKFLTSQDYDLWLRMSRVGQIDNLPETLMHYRKHADRVSAKSNASRQTLYSVAAACDHWLREIGKPEISAPLDPNAPSAVSDALITILGSPLDRETKRGFSRHVNRYLRHVKAIDPDTRKELIAGVAPYTSTIERVRLTLGL